MADSHFRKLDASIVSAAVVLSLIIAASSGVAAYFLGLRHAERRAAVRVERLEAQSRNQADIASRQLGRCLDDNRLLKQMLEDVKAHYKDELAKAREIAAEERARAKDAVEWAHKLESLLAEEGR